MSARSGPEADSSRQERLYVEIHDEYVHHYFDAESMQYRREFIIDPLLAGLDFNGMKVAELACSGGANSRMLIERYPDVDITGFDISPAACEEYRETVGRPCHQLDLTKGETPESGFDVAVVIGAIHHCVADLPGTFRTIAKMVRPGGQLLMMEPSCEYVLEGARKLWYRADPYFDAPTEEALAHDAILRTARPFFRPNRVQHLGGPGYLLILQSLAFRMPKPVKRAISPPLMAFDRLYNRLPGRLPFPYFLARWDRTDAEL